MSSALRKVVVRVSRILPLRSFSTEQRTGRILTSGLPDIEIPKISVNECVLELVDDKWGGKIAAVRVYFFF